MTATVRIAGGVAIWFGFLELVLNGNNAAIGAACLCAGLSAALACEEP